MSTISQIPAAAPEIAMEDAVLHYGAHRVLDGLTLSMAAGEIYALLGGNGAGKSTTLSALLGFVRVDGGRVRVGGIDPAADPDAARRRIAYLPENVALYEHLSAVENADYLLALSGTPRERTAITDALAAAGLQERAFDQRLGGFSKGCAKRSRSRSRCCARCRCCCSTSRPRASIRVRPPTSTRCSMRSARAAPPC